MRQLTTTFHELQIRKKYGHEWGTWERPIGFDSNAAEMLAIQGRLIEAIHEAQNAYLRKFPSMHSVELRCVTTAKTITVCAGAIVE